MIDNVRISRSGPFYLIVLNGTVVAAYENVEDAYHHIVWMHKTFSQKFTVGANAIPVHEWMTEGIRLGFLPENAGTWEGRHGRHNQKVPV